MDEMFLVTMAVTCVLTSCYGNEYSLVEIHTGCLGYSLVSDVHGEDVPVLLAEPAEVQVDLAHVVELRHRTYSRGTEF